MLSTVGERVSGGRRVSEQAVPPFPELSEQLEKDLVQVFKLLADETRLKILMFLLRDGELHVSALCDKLGQSSSAVSHHLALLRVAGIVEPRRDGKHNYYSVCQRHFHQLAGEMFATISDPRRDEFRFKNFVVTKDEDFKASDLASPEHFDFEWQAPSLENPQCNLIMLEQFDGLVDQIDGGTAFVTLTANDGEKLVGEYSGKEFARLGIHERRRFTCQTIVVDGEVEVRFQPIVDIEVMPEEEADIDRELDELIAGGELDGDY